MPVGESKRPYFPHLLPVEVWLWRAFLIKFEEKWDRFEYDVHVGAGADLSAAPPDEFTANFTTLTQKRIDAVGWKGNTPTIFEVRERASLEMVGKLEGYGILFARQFPTVPIPTLWLVCRFASTDDLSVAALKKIAVARIEPPEPSPSANA